MRNRVLVLLLGASLTASLALPVAGHADPSSYRLEEVRDSAGVHHPRWDPCRIVRYSVDTRFLHVGTKRKQRARRHITRAVRVLSHDTGLRFKLVKHKSKKLPTRRQLHTKAQHLRVVFMSPSHKGESTWFLPRNAGAGRFGGYTRFLSRPATDTEGERTRTIRRAVVALDADQYVQHPWGFKGRKASTGDLLLHEMGHAVGLAHVADPSQVMSGGRLSLKTYTGNTYQDGDEAGLRLVGAEQGCLIS